MMEYHIIKENILFRLEIEELYTEWWVVLVEKKTGLAQTVIFDQKSQAYKFVQGLSIGQVSDKMGGWDVPKEKYVE